MRKLALILASLIMIAVVSGCIGTETPETSTAVNSAAPTSQSLGTKTYSPDELLKGMEKIKMFTYSENTSMKLILSVREGNTTQDENITVVYRKTGYIDLKDREAAVNITTITFPGGAPVFSRQIIKNNEIYIFTGGNWIKLTNGTSKLNVSRILNLTWNYNVVSFAKKYLKKQPSNVSFENGTELLYFPITKEDLAAITSAFLGSMANVTLNVTNGILELKFKNGTFVGGRMAYGMDVFIKFRKSPGAVLEVHERGHVYDEFVVTDINIKKTVKLPISYRA